MSDRTAAIVEATEGADAYARMREYQRRYVILCRAHGIGNHPLTGAKPVKRPLLNWTVSMDFPEFAKQRDALQAEYADVAGKLVDSRDLTFAEADLTA